MRSWLRRLRPVVPVLVVLALVISQRASLACSLVQFSDFEQIAPAIWVDPAMSPAQRAEVLRLIEVGRASVGDFYGEYRARPTIIVGADMERLSWFTNNSYGTTHYSLLGVSVVIGPDGQNADVMSHELAHPELFTRIGWWQTIVTVPTWFDEGLAMQFDQREKYDEAAYQALAAKGALAPLDTMRTGSGFFNDQAVEHYVQARHDVATRVARAGKPGVLRLIDELSHGRAFHDL
jgi:hypothetical protein